MRDKALLFKTLLIEYLETLKSELKKLLTYGDRIIEF